jgi:hypothetical protein
MNEGSAADLDFALNQLNQSSPPPPPSADGMGHDPVQPASSDAKPDADFEYDGSTRKETHSAWSAAKELSHTRRKRGQEADGADPAINFVDPLRYQREPEGELTTEQAAKDLSEYRRQTAQQLLQELTGGEQTPSQPEVVSTPQPEPPPQYTPEQLEMAAQRQATVESWQHAANAAQHYDVLLQAQLHQMMGVGQQEFADVKALADQIGEQAAVAQLAQKDPARFARFQEADQKFRAAQVELGRIRQQQADTYAANYRQYGEREDAAAERAIPELGPTADPRARLALQQATRDALLDAGFSNEELLQNWTHGNSAVMLRDHRVQRVIADAARWRLGQQKMKEAVKAPHPEVQRPGVRQPQSSYSDQQIAAASKALSGSGNIRDAVALRRAMFAQQRQQRGG